MELLVHIKEHFCGQLYEPWMEIVTNMCTEFIQVVEMVMKWEDIPCRGNGDRMR